MRPVLSSVQLTTLKVGSRIHIQAMVLSTVGTMNGRSRKARARFLPRNGWLMTRAMASPPTILSEGGDDGVDEGVAGHPPEDGVGASAAEVGEPDEDARCWPPAAPAGSGRSRRRTGRRRRRAGRGRREPASPSRTTPSRSMTPAQGQRAPATGAGRASDAGPTAIALLRAVDLLELGRGGGDDAPWSTCPGRPWRTCRRSRTWPGSPTSRGRPGRASRAGATSSATP